MSSLSASRVYPGGQAVYAASKAVLNQLTRHLAAEFGVLGVRVNALAPNNFPSVVRTESVASAIARLDGESVTDACSCSTAPNSPRRQSARRSFSDASSSCRDVGS